MYIAQQIYFVTHYNILKFYRHNTGNSNKKCHSLDNEFTMCKVLKTFRHDFKSCLSATFFSLTRWCCFCMAMQCTLLVCYMMHRHDQMFVVLCVCKLPSAQHIPIVPVYREAQIAHSVSGQAGSLCDNYVFIETKHRIPLCEASVNRPRSPLTRWNNKGHPSFSPSQLSPIQCHHQPRPFVVTSPWRPPISLSPVDGYHSQRSKFKLSSTQCKDTNFRFKISFIIMTWTAPQGLMTVFVLICTSTRILVQVFITYKLYIIISVFVAQSMSVSLLDYSSLVKKSFSSHWLICLFACTCL